MTAFSRMSLLRPGLMPLWSVLLACAVWMTPLIINSPGVYQLCAEYDMQTPSPMSEEEEVAQSKSLPSATQVGDWVPDLGSTLALPQVEQLPMGSLLEVPYPPPRTLA
jgi:hypothetical protein